MIVIPAMGLVTEVGKEGFREKEDVEAASHLPQILDSGGLGGVFFPSVGSL